MIKINGKTVNGMFDLRPDLETYGDRDDSPVWSCSCDICRVHGAAPWHHLIFGRMATA